MTSLARRIAKLEPITNDFSHMSDADLIEELKATCTEIEVGFGPEHLPTDWRGVLETDPWSAVDVFRGHWK